MKRLASLLIFSILILGLISTVSAYTAHELWPVNMGNEWTYEIKGQINDGQTFTVKVTRHSSGWAYLDGTDEFYGTGWGDRWWWMSHTSGSIWTWNPEWWTSSRVFNLSVGEGHTFTSYIKGAICLDKTLWKVTDEDGSITTPVGTFHDCVIIDNVKPVCADAGLTRMVFAPHVGPVEYSWTTIAGGHTARLIHAMVNGREYKRIDELGGYIVSLTIDKITYLLTENRMPPIPPEGPPQYPDTLIARFKIENKTNETVTFHHSSSQEYDFIIRDEHGNEVYRWSHGRAFLTVLTDVTLKPGESVVYREAIVLRSNLYKNDSAINEALPPPLKPDNYTIEGLHTTMGEELRQKGVAAFKIDLRIVY